jgi:Na+/H+ antiporter NhaD/arsenite permease-like protein
MQQGADNSSDRSNSRVVWSIGLIVLIYISGLVIGPRALDRSTDHAGPASSHGGTTANQVDHAPQEPTANGPGATVMPHVWAVIPFVLLLSAIALLPLFRRTEHWWESNLHRFYVSIALAVATLFYYFFLYPGGGGMEQIRHVLDHAVLREFVPFIVLLFSLYTICGGIRIDGDLVASPATNARFLIVGGALASFIGTTGAAMLLIRPLIDTNDERKWVQHTVVFFVFVVCNCGGCLLPIGDPPLFLGYLKGVEFLWTMSNLWFPWLVTNTMLIGLYYLIDRFIYYPRETKTDIRIDKATARPLRVRGLWPNAALLLGVILAVALLDPLKALPGTQWHAPPYLREIVQLMMVAISLRLGSCEIRSLNRFNYHAIVEVAALFIGIFVCMQPAIGILHVRGGELGLDTPMELFWTTGTLSAVLDNAPTYVVFYETAAADPRFAGTPFHELVSSTTAPFADEANELLRAISLGAVFMGSMTYIGNGPNFMVRAIAEQSNIRMPSFFGYMLRYSIPLLVPVFVLLTMLLLT